MNPLFRVVGLFRLFDKVSRLIVCTGVLFTPRLLAQTTFPAPVTIAADAGGTPLFLKGRSSDNLSQIMFMDSNGTAHGLYQTFADGTITFVGTTGSGSGGLVERMRIAGNGAVGVGMAPSGYANFEVNGYIGAVGATSPYIQLYATAGAVGQKFWRTGIAGGSMVFEQVNDAYTTPTERFRISPDGSVGIGTPAPVRPLHVATSAGGEFILEGTNGQANYRKWNFYVGGGSGGQKALFLRILNDAGSASTVDSTTWLPNGSVGIGTSNTGSNKLAVNGAIRAKEVIVDTGWADYVFAEDYRLAPLAEVEAHIKSEKHLPGIPSAMEVAERGVSVGEMQARLLAKIEELTLHVIAQEKRILKVENENKALRSKHQ